MGSSTALFLARKGAGVSLFEAASRPFDAASRWNEGKIHLGFLYNADPSMRTAECIFPGSLLFKPLVEDLIGASLVPVTTSSDDLYLCHRHSVVPPEEMAAYCRRLSERVSRHPDAVRYLVDVSHCRVERMTPSELRSITDSPEIVAGFRVPERSVATTWVADRFVTALAAEPSIELRLRTSVTAVRSQSKRGRDCWLVESGHDVFGPFDFVVNALWEGRMAVDVSAGLSPQGIWSNRFRRSLFLRTTEPVAIPSAIITTGPFGDMKNYNNRNFYLSWYPIGLAAESSEVAPSPMAPLDEPSKRRICIAVLEALNELLPMSRRLVDRIEELRLEGGWVFAAGKGALSDPASTLHHRYDFGTIRKGNYFSVDTGKYATAPWWARRIADLICP